MHAKGNVLDVWGRVSRFFENLLVVLGLEKFRGMIGGEGDGTPIRLIENHYG